jgi:hypothetical protein
MRTGTVKFEASLGRPTQQGPGPRRSNQNFRFKQDVLYNISYNIIRVPIQVRPVDASPPPSMVLTASDAPRLNNHGQRRPQLPDGPPADGRPDPQEPGRARPPHTRPVW